MTDTESDSSFCPRVDVTDANGVYDTGDSNSSLNQEGTDAMDVGCETEVNRDDDDDDSILDGLDDMVNADSIAEVDGDDGDDDNLLNGLDDMHNRGRR